MLSRKPVSGQDAVLAASLVPYFLLSWIVPQRFWKSTTSLAGRISQKGSIDKLVSRIESVPESAHLSVNPRQIAVNLNAQRIEHYFQILRDYRPDGWTENVVLEGREHLQKAAEAGKGAVLWVAHFVFNGLAPKLALHREGFPAAHLSRPEHGFSKTRFGISFLNPIRARIEDRYLSERILIERGSEEKATRQALKVLKRGGVVSITAGAWEGRRVELCPCLGTRFPLASGGASIARLSGAPLLPVFTVRETIEGKSAFRVIVEEPIPIDKAAPRDFQIAHACEAYGKRLEHWVRAYPDQWRGWGYVEERADG
jgi:lauroyl/myristoyl acyltransferase